MLKCRSDRTHIPILQTTHLLGQNLQKVCPCSKRRQVTCKTGLLFLENILLAHTFCILSLREVTDSTGLCYPQVQDHSDCPHARPSGVPIAQELTGGPMPGRWPQHLASCQISQHFSTGGFQLMLTVDMRLVLPKARTLNLHPSKHQLKFSYGPTTTTHSVQSFFSFLPQTTKQLLWEPFFSPEASVFHQETKWTSSAELTQLVEVLQLLLSYGMKGTV